jgi:flagellar basal-body rod modification protein FlgD
MELDKIKSAAYPVKDYYKSALKVRSSSMDEEDEDSIIDQNMKSSSATDRGTRIVKKGNELDKNAFLRILTAELSNQDPMNTKDSTQFVSQLAQFASLEQMANLNSTMTSSSAHSLLGKVVALDNYDDMGVQYGGVVQSVTKNGENIKLNVQVVENGQYVNKDFDFKSVSDVFDTVDTNLANMDYNMNFLMSSSFIGKKVKAANAEATYVGKVKSTYKDSYGINLSVMVDGKVTSEKMTPEHDYTKDEVVVNGVYDGDKDTRLYIKYIRYPEQDHAEYQYKEEGQGEDQGEYQYKFVDEGQKEEEVEWAKLPEDKKIRGIKVITQEEAPIADAEWYVDFEYIEPELMNFFSNNVYEVSEDIESESK